MDRDDTYYRDRILELESRIESLDLPSEGSTCEAAQTTDDGGYPTEANRYYAVVPIVLGGTEAEGESATITTLPNRVFYALNLGDAVPPVGTRLIVSRAGGRWVFNYSGG